MDTLRKNIIFAKISALRLKRNIISYGITRITLHSTTGDKNFDKLLWFHSLIGFFNHKRSRISVKVFFLFIFIYPVCLSISTETAVRKFEVLKMDTLPLRFINLTLICAASIEQWLIILGSKDIQNFITKCIAIRKKFEKSGINETDTSKLSQRLYKIRIFLMCTFFSQSIQMVTDNSESALSFLKILWIGSIAKISIEMVVLAILAMLLSSQEVLLPTAMAQLSDIFSLLNEQVAIISDNSEKRDWNELIEIFVENHKETIDLTEMFKKTFGMNVLVQTFASFMTITVSIFMLAVMVGFS